MNNDTILIVTASYDQSAQLVLDHLRTMGAHTFRLDTDQFPTQVKARYDPRRGLFLCNADSSVHSSQISSVWYRRNVAPQLPEHLDKYHQEFCTRESRAFLEGALATIRTERWLSPPSAISRAERKMYQLSVANDIGFTIPDTAATNDEAHARQFTSSRQTIAKAVSSGYIDSATGYRAMFTTALSPDDLRDLSGLELAPVTFQEHVTKKSDIRVTVVGDHVFAAEILSQTHHSSATDWRATDNLDLPHRIHQLPTKLENLCTDLVRHLGLGFGAIDLALTEDDQYIFFEINPNGEWLWIELQLGFPISQRIAQWLFNNHPSATASLNEHQTSSGPESSGPQSPSHNETQSTGPSVQN